MNVEYQVPTGKVSDGSYVFEYILKTGASFHGPIERLNITLELQKTFPWHRGIVIKPASWIEIKDSTIKWEFRKVKPTEDIRIAVNSCPVHVHAEPQLTPNQLTLNHVDSATEDQDRDGKHSIPSILRKNTYPNDLLIGYITTVSRLESHETEYRLFQKNGAMAYSYRVAETTDLSRISIFDPQIEGPNGLRTGLPFAHLNKIGTELVCRLDPQEGSSKAICKAQNIPEYVFAFSFQPPFSSARTAKVLTKTDWKRLQNKTIESITWEKPDR